MPHESVKVNVIIDDKIFKNFSMFESFHRRRAYLSPLIFAAIMSASAITCLLMDAILLGAVLLIIGLGLPSFRVSKIFRAINEQIRILDLKNPKTVYSLHFTDTAEGIEVTNHGEGEEPLRYKWKEIYGAYRVKKCVYLYVLPEKAYILPDGQSEEGPEALLRIFRKKLPSKKLHGRFT